MTYRVLTPFMKGLHLLTDSWRKNRAADGWKVQDRDWEAYLQQAVERGELTEDEYISMLFRDEENTAPERLFSSSVLRFADNLETLEQFFEIKAPPVVSDSVSRLAFVIYAFTDASGLGFRDTFLFDQGIEYTIGTWGSDEEGESSNYKELRNTVDAIERHAVEGN
jgi:hypothetical protein